MLLVPYKADLNIERIPIFTILICLVCVFVYYQQQRNDKAVLYSTAAFCVANQPTTFTLAMKAMYKEASPERCRDLMAGIHLARDPQAFMDEQIGNAGLMTGYNNKRDSDLFLREVVTQNYREFAARTPPSLTAKLWYDPTTWNPLKMITASFAHGSWGHVIGNLFFFIAFAATIEMVVGYALFPLVIVALAIGSYSFYFFFELASLQSPRTLGLSGVVSGVMALFVYFLPRVKIRVFLWVVVFFKRFGVPAWLFVGWFVGWDTYTLLSGGDHAGINIAAHVGGALFGYLLGMAAFRAKRRELVEMQAAAAY